MLHALTGYALPARFRRDATGFPQAATTAMHLTLAGKLKAVGLAKYQEDEDPARQGRASGRRHMSRLEPVVSGARGLSG